MSREQIGYVHLLNGMPAQFDGRQIVFVSGSNKSPIRAVSDLAIIKHQQRASRKWRKAQGFDDDKKYSHRRVIIG